VQLRNTLIPAIAKNFDIPCHRSACTAFIKFKVVTTA
jgi:hypothetical protein